MNKSFFTALDGVPATVSVDSEVFPVSNMGKICLQAEIEGSTSGTGTVKVQVTSLISDDGQPTGWADLASGSLSFTADASKITTVLDVAAKFAKVVFTYASGTGGTLTAVVALREF